MKKPSFTLLLIVLSLLVTASALVGWLGIPGTGGAANVAASAGKVSIPIADLNDGKAHFYSYKGQAGKITFFVIKGKDGTLRAAFDACDVCYKEKKGYEQKGDQMICKNCNMAFPVTKIGTVNGGCNPSPLKTTQNGATLEIASSDLEGGAHYFR
ncbi:MAG: DUF2318 domain-containing protein [Desulfuromonadales bacterium]|nr:DUF2318 domain-containing protein [Desulfuromonadales bacterium]